MPTWEIGYFGLFWAKFGLGSLGGRSTTRRRDLFKMRQLQNQTAKFKLAWTNEIAVRF